jgi:hypothetical protein
MKFGQIPFSSLVAISKKIQGERTDGRTHARTDGRTHANEKKVSRFHSGTNNDFFFLENKRAMRQQHGGKLNYIKFLIPICVGASIHITTKFVCNQNVNIGAF